MPEATHNANSTLSGIMASYSTTGNMIWQSLMKEIINQKNRPMKLHKTLQEYEQVAAVGDKIALGGKGLMDGIKSLESKHDVVRVHKIEPCGQIVFKRYRGKTPLIVADYAYDQEVAVLSEKEYANLPVYY